MNKLATFLCLSLILSTFNVAYAATSGDSGSERWVLLEDTTGTNYTLTANITVPETVYDDTPTSFSILYIINNTGNTTANEFDYTVVITIGDQTASTATSINVTYNHTVEAKVEFSAFQLLNGTNEEGNNTITITLKCGDVQKDIWNGYIYIEKYGFGIEIWFVIVPSLVAIMVTIKVVAIMKKKLNL